MTDPTHKNRLLNISEYCARLPILTSMPQYVMVELTQGCNLVCPMCRKSKRQYSKREMSQNTFNRIAAQLFATAELVDLRGWGESIILPNFVSLLLSTAKAVKKIRLVTNFSFNCPDVIRALSQVGAYVVVSLDSADQEILSTIRKGTNLEKVVANLQTLTKLYLKNWGSTSRICINCTLQRPALKGISKLVRLAADCRVDEIRVSAVSVPETSPLSLSNSESELHLALNEMIQAADKLGVRLCASTRLGKMAHKHASHVPCLHPWAYTYVSYDGKVGFCDHLIGPRFTSYLMGDLKKDDFQRIWNSRAWAEVRRRHSRPHSALDKKLPQCHWCYRNRFVEFEDLFLPEKRADKVLLNRI